MADTETTRCAGEAPVSDQRDLVAHTLTVEGSRGLQHLAHTGTTARSLVTNDENFAFLVFAIFNGVEAGFFTIEATGRTGKLQISHTGDFHDRTFRREITFQ